MRTSRRDPGDRVRADAQSGKILEMLIAAGSQGCTNSQLWEVCHAVNSRISGLRKRGHKIDATAEGGGVWRYRLVVESNPDKPTHFEQLRQRELEQQAPLFAHAGVSP